MLNETTVNLVITGQIAEWYCCEPGDYRTKCYIILLWTRRLQDKILNDTAVNRAITGRNAEWYCCEPDDYRTKCWMILLWTGWLQDEMMNDAAVNRVITGQNAEWYCFEPGDYRAPLGVNWILWRVSLNLIFIKFKIFLMKL